MVGVFGKCIAGRGLSGNFKYFVALPVLGYLGGFTCVGFTAAAVALQYGPAACLAVVIGVPITVCVIAPMFQGVSVLSVFICRSCCPKCMPPRPAPMRMRGVIEM